MTDEIRNHRTYTVEETALKLHYNKNYLYWRVANEKTKGLPFIRRVQEPGRRGRILFLDVDEWLEANPRHKRGRRKKTDQNSMRNHDDQGDQK